MTWYPVRVTLARQTDGALGGMMACGSVALEIRGWQRTEDGVAFELDTSFEALVQRLVEMART